MNLTTRGFSCLSAVHISYFLPYKSCHERETLEEKVRETRTGEEKDNSAAALRLGRAPCRREGGWSAGWSDPLPHFSRLGGGGRVTSRRSAGLGRVVARRGRGAWEERAELSEGAESAALRLPRVAAPRGCYC